MIEVPAVRPVRAASLLCALLLSTLVASQVVAATEPALKGVVNVNTASESELTLLPGVGEARARAIVSMRKQRGGFKSIEELLEVKGIGESMLAKLRPYVVLSGKTTARRL